MPVYVEADSKAEALKKAMNGEGEDIEEDSHFSHTPHDGTDLEHVEEIIGPN